VSRLRITNLRKGYTGTPVLQGVDLDIPSGSLSAVLGLSGCGKTTLLRLIAGFERPERGTIRLGARTLEDETSYTPPEGRNIGYVPQEGALFPHMSVTANIGFGLPRRERSQGAVEDLLELVGLQELGKRYPHQLSGGEQQRVALARALARRPELLLLDEPFSSLDAAMRAHVREEVHELLRAQGVTTVMVTHDQEEALSLADSVAVLRGGTIVQQGTPESLYTAPRDTALASFLGSANVIEAVFSDGAAQTPLGTLALRSDSQQQPGTHGVVLLRPEQLAVRERPSDGEPAGSAELAGTVEQCRYYGHDALLRIRPAAPAGLELLLARVHGDDALPEGTHVLVEARGPVTRMR
jgi:iron(III) transport system ATP-binding protein